MVGDPITPALIARFLERCGYTAHSRLVHEYQFDNTSVAYAGFYGQPFDTRSACVAVTEAGKQEESKTAASACMGLGAPTAFVSRGDAVDCWRLSPDGPSDSRTINANGLDRFFEEFRQELTPEAIYAAKLHRLPKPKRERERQLWFVDVGLMPATERRAGESLHRLVEDVVLRLMEDLEGRLNKKKDSADLYKTVFWLLATKLLHEKDVENFRKIDLTDVDTVFSRVGRHYTDSDDLPPGSSAWRKAIRNAAKTVSEWGYLGNISTESLAYLYETAFIDNRPKGRALTRAEEADRDIRKELGIHSTPSVLVDHMLSQLWPIVEAYHEPDARHIFEPACGVAGFLVAAMRWLRDFTELPPNQSRPAFLRRHLHGIEIEPFAAELARLSLTLADVPFGNSWDIAKGQDMFVGGALERIASKSALLLANPPYETFRPEQKDSYARGGNPITAQTKAVEMLKRTLPNLPPNGVFGVVVPQGVLYDNESRGVRRFLMRDCELTEISLFADTLFEEGEHEVAVLMGRRKGDTSPGKSSITYRRVRENGMNAFKERLAFSTEQTVPQSRFTLSHNLYLPELSELWDYLGRNKNKTLGSFAKIGQGIAYKNERNLPEGAWTIHDPPEESDSLGYAKGTDMKIYSVPNRVGMNLDRSVILHVRTGMPTGKPQVLLNYGRGSREPWRLRAVIDYDGLAITSRLINVRPLTGTLGPLEIWAVLNSPLANAFAHSHTMKRDVLVGMIRRVPMPAVPYNYYSSVRAAAQNYLNLVTAMSREEDKVRAALLRMDAEVLKLYDLPPRLERMLLDTFSGIERRGVGCEFLGYYPEGMEAFMPLHELVSEQISKSTLGNFLSRSKPMNSPRIFAALRGAKRDWSEE